MSEILLNIFVSGLLWFPFGLAVGLTYRHLKLIDVSIDGVAVVAGIGTALTWRVVESLPLSLLVATLLGVSCSILLGGMIHALRIEPLLAGVLLTLGLHSVSVLAVGESLPLPGTRVAGAPGDFLGLLAGLAAALILLTTLFYRSHFGVLVRAIGSNPSFASPLPPRFVITVGLALSGLLVGLGAGVYVHAEGLARAGGGFDFLLTGFTSFLAVDRLLEPIRRRLSTAISCPGRSDIRAGVMALLGSVPTVALLGAFFFQALVFAVLTVAPRPDLWKLALALILIASVARPQWRLWRRREMRAGCMLSTAGLAVIRARVTLPGLTAPRVLLDDLSFACEPGLAVLRGPNGAGKSTLLRVLRGDAELEAGEILVGGREVHRLPSHERGIFLVRQDPYENLATDLTVYENLLSVAKPRHEPLRLASLKQVQESLGVLQGRIALPLDHLLTPEFLQCRAGLISGGEAQCVALLMSVLAEAPVILADEPTASLDIENQRRVRDLLVSLASQRVILTASHDPFLAERSPIILNLQKGEISDGPPFSNDRGG
jgi:ABC-type multidrug transport system ATPase subunit/ABC-type uncharacterized transport system permease subunit